MFIIYHFIDKFPSSQLFFLYLVVSDDLTSTNKLTTAGFALRSRFSKKLRSETKNDLAFTFLFGIADIETVNDLYLRAGINSIV